MHNLSGNWRQWQNHYGLAAGTAGYISERWLRTAHPYDAVISDSKWMQEALQDDLGKDKVTWIPNGVNINRFSPTHVDDRQEVRFLYVGRFVALKGHSTLIESFAEVIKTGANAKLHLAGDGPDWGACNQLVHRLGLQNHVVFHGRVAHESMPAIYQQMDVYVSPSQFEGLPVTFLEAMACGLPIISGRIRAVQGILDNSNSVLFDADSAQALASVMLEMIEKPEMRASLGRAGRILVEQRFTWERVVDDELAFYQCIMKRPTVTTPYGQQH